jgi:hypothetical protein
LDLSADSRAVDVKGSYAYVGTMDMGVNIIKVSNPQDLEFVDSEDTVEARGVKISDSYVYVADATAGLVVMSISD